MKLDTFNLDKRKFNDISPNSSEGKVYKISKMSDKLLLEEMKKMMDEMTKDLKSYMEDNLNKLKSELSDYRAENNKLQQEIDDLKNERQRDRRLMLQLEDKLKQKNIILRGLNLEADTTAAIQKVLTNNFKITDHIKINSSRKLFDRNGRMAVIAEVENGAQIVEIFKHAKNLAGSSISVERDLNTDRQQQKKVMLALKRNILTLNQTHKISVREDRLRIADKWFTWNWRKQLVCGSMNGVDAIKGLYGSNLNGISFDFNSILSNLNLKN